MFQEQPYLSENDKGLSFIWAHRSPAKLCLLKLGFYSPQGAGKYQRHLGILSLLSEAAIWPAPQFFSFNPQNKQDQFVKNLNLTLLPPVFDNTLHITRPCSWLSWGLPTASISLKSDFSRNGSVVQKAAICCFFHYFLFLWDCITWIGWEVGVLPWLWNVWWLTALCQVGLVSQANQKIKARLSNIQDKDGWYAYRYAIDTYHV